MAKTYAQMTDVIATAANIGAISLAPDDVLFVGPKATVVATGASSDGIRAARGSTVMINGAVFGANDGIEARAGANVETAHITVGIGAEVTGGASGIHMTGILGTVMNAGTITGAMAIWFEQGKADVYNSGHLYSSGRKEAVHFSGDGNRLRNLGTVTALGDNAIVGGAGADNVINKGQIVGAVDLKAGDDRFENIGDFEQVFGGDGNDTLISSAPFQAGVVPGANQAGLLSGGNGDDVLRAFAGVLQGDAGNDRLVIDGQAEAAGGAGNDIITFSASSRSGSVIRFAEDGDANFDRLRHFHGSKSNDFPDVIALDQRYFTALAVGDLSVTAFCLGSAAINANQHIIFDSSNRTIWYDRDGSGSATATRIAVIDSFVDTTTGIANNNFTVF